MIYKVDYTKKYKKDYKRILKRNLNINLLKTVIKLLSNGEQLDKRYCKHVLTGRYEGLYECHIKPDWLLIYMIDEENKVITLVRTGSHSDLF